MFPCGLQQASNKSNKATLVHMCTQHAHPAPAKSAQCGSLQGHSWFHKDILMHDITGSRASKYEPTYRHTPHRFVIDFNTRHVKPQVTNDFVPFGVHTPHTHTRHRQKHTALKYCYGNSWPQGFVEPKTLDTARCFITSLTCLHVDPP